jgi:hypothetical protein
MGRTRALIALTGAALCAGLYGPGCTNSDLYQLNKTPYQANKLTLSGSVCTDDLHQSNFPMKILFLVDMSQSLRSSNNDPNFRRAQAIQDILGLWGKNQNYHFGIAIFGSSAANLLTDSTGTRSIAFSRDMSKLQAAVGVIKSGGGTAASVAACRSARCRDYRSAISLASSLITGDILAADPGEVARTTYAVVMFTGGPPVPAMGRCPCRKADDEKKGGKWAPCPWSECDGCTVTCPPGATCKKDVCTDSTGRVVTPLLFTPTIYPDTYTFMIPPPVGGTCQPLTCVYAKGGNPESCEELVLTKDVRELRTFALNNGAGQFQFHTTYLPDLELRDPTSKYSSRKSTDPYFPPAPCNGRADIDKARTVRLLSQMSYAGAGSTQVFTSAEQISGGFLKVGQDLFTSRDPLVYKEFLVSNENVLATPLGLQVDTDGDGLSDLTEQQLKTCPEDEDSDGDGLGDALEVKLALDPLKAGSPVECLELKFKNETGEDPCNEGTDKTWIRYDNDKDRDGLNACEERLLGTEDTLYDSDADGIPDRVEFKVGTNYLAVDPHMDADQDGVTNREEVRSHTDPRSFDAQSKLDLAYRYEEVDEGLRKVLSFTQPTNITGVTIKNVSPGTSPGTGYLKFDPGPPPTLTWKDHADSGAGGAYGPPVDITKPSPEGVKVTSCRRTASGGCSADSQLRYITVLTDGPGYYPPTAMAERINVSSAMRNCLRFTVRNVTLLETGKHRVLGTRGNNIVNLYFGEAPQKVKNSYGMFRIARVRVTYLKGPPEQRTPKSAVIDLKNDDFYIDVASK